LTKFELTRPGPTRRILWIVAWGVVVTVCSVAFAYSQHLALASVMLGLCSLAFIGRYGELTRSQPPGNTVWALLVAAILVGSLLWGAMSGNTRLSNEWFMHSTWRPLIALGGWMFYMAGASLLLRRESVDKVAMPSMGSGEQSP